MAYPINVYPTRYAIEVMCYPTEWLPAPASSSAHTESATGEVAAAAIPQKTRHAKLRHFALTLAIAVLTLLTALALPSIDTVFSLMGGTCSAFVCYLIPSAVAWRLGDRVPQMRTPLGRCAVFGLGAFGLIVGVLSTTTTIISLFQNQDDDDFDPCTQWSSPPLLPPAPPTPQHLSSAVVAHLDAVAHTTLTSLGSGGWAEELSTVGS